MLHGKVDVNSEVDCMGGKQIRVMMLRGETEHVTGLVSGSTPRRLFQRMEFAVVFLQTVHANNRIFLKVGHQVSYPVFTISAVKYIGELKLLVKVLRIVQLVSNFTLVSVMPPIRTVHSVPFLPSLYNYS